MHAVIHIKGPVVINIGEVNEINVITMSQVRARPASFSRLTCQSLFSCHYPSGFIDRQKRIGLPTSSPRGFSTQP